MIVNRRIAKLAGVSALAIVAFGIAGPTTASACVATADTSGTNTVTVNSVTVDCNAGDPDSALFGTDVDGSTTTGGATYLDYDGSGDDTLNLLGGVISNDSTANQPPPVTNLYPGAQLNGQVNGVYLFDGDDVINMSGGTIDGSLFSDGNATAGDGDDSIAISGGQINGTVFAGGGADLVVISGTANIGVAAGQLDSVGLEDGDDAFTMSGGTLSGGVSGGAGADRFTLSGGTIGDFVAGGVGSDLFDISGNVVITNNLSGEDGNDRVAMSGGTIGSFIDLGAGTDTFVMTGGLVRDYVLGGDGIDDFQISGGTVGEAGGDGPEGIFGGNGADRVRVEGGTVANVDGEGDDDAIEVSGGTVSGDVSGGDGDDAMVLDGGAIGGAVLGGTGNDAIGLVSGTLAGRVDAGDGNDNLVFSGAAVSGSFNGGLGVDTVVISGGSIVSYVDLDDGDDVLQMTGGSLGFHIEGNGGNDRISVLGGAITGEVLGNAGTDTIVIGATADIGSNVKVGADDDTITVTGGRIGGDVDGGGGADVVTVSGGTIVGDINAATVNLLGGTIGGDITGLSDSTLTIQSSSLGLRDGVLFSGAADNAIGTITNTDLAGSTGPGAPFQSQNFAGFSTLGVNNSAIGFAGGTQEIASLLLNDSTLHVSGLTNLVDPTGGAGNLSATNSVIDMVNGSTSDVFNVGNLTLNGATIGLDLNPQSNLADQLVASGALTATGGNVIAVNIVGTPNFATSGVIPIAPITGETAPTGPGGTGAPLFTVSGLPNTPGALFDYAVVTGSGGGLYLVVIPADVTDPVAPRVAIDSSILNNVTETTNGIIGDALLAHLGLLNVATRSDAAPNFGVYASGQLAFTKHDGFEISTSGSSVAGPSFTSDDFSLAGSVEFDAAQYFGIDQAYGLDLGLFGGFASSDVHLDPTALFDELGAAKNRSGMIGSYGLLRKGTTYGLVSLTGFFGGTDVDNYVLDSTGDYGTAGVAVTGTVGKIVQLDDAWRLDVRGGLLGVNFEGDSYEDSQGNNYGKSRISFGALKFEPGLYAQYVLADGRVLSPYFRLELQQRFGYRNTSSLDDVDFKFDDADFSGSLSGGVNYQISKTTTLSTETKMKVSEDSTSFAGKLGIKAKF